MVASEKITILLADEDALRRDGLAAVLRGASQYEIVAQCPDGGAALDEIRRLQPEVAVIDLNLPGMHGIELVRRIRGEALGTKVVILSGTSDDEIIREVVRAGGDAYLLKNGPARHLIDAISYVRDGGQYFSPQLRRDGRDRHLLEETPRVAPERSARMDDTNADGEDAPAAAEEPVSARCESRDNRGSRVKRASIRTNGRTVSDPRRLRERLQADAGAEDLDERDYDILTMMADGIRPILDRLEEIEGRIGDMESGDAPVPSNVRYWLNNQMADTFQEPRNGSREVAVERTVSDLEARLPQMIEEAVTKRFHNMASRLQQEIEETHVRTLETFVKNIQVKLVQRVSALETDMARQADAMNQLREYSQRTEDNLSRLITGVDKLAQELPRRLQAPEFAQASVDVTPVRRKSSRSLKPLWTWLAIIVVAGAIFGVVRMMHRATLGADVPAPASSSSAAAGSSAGAVATAAGTDAKTKMQAADQYAERKDYATAEDIYKQILKTEPNNVDAMKALASVLYREDKIDESAAIVDKMPRN